MKFVDTRASRNLHYQHQQNYYYWILLKKSEETIHKITRLKYKKHFRHTHNVIYNLWQPVTNNKEDI